MGRCEGTYECNGAFDDGTPYSEGPADQSIRIDRALDGSIFIAGSCSIPLEVVSARRAEVAPTSCNSTRVGAGCERARWAAAACRGLVPSAA